MTTDVVTGGQKQFDAYLNKTIKNVAKYTVREKVKEIWRRKECVNIDDAETQLYAPEQVLDFSMYPADACGHKILFENKDLAEAFDQLSDKQKIALFLRYFEGLTYEEIGKFLDITAQSVCNRIQNGCKKLKDKLPEDFI
jgi:RNA polymerase sigma factor (sigma-70 family)